MTEEVDQRVDRLVASAGYALDPTDRAGNSLGVKPRHVRRTFAAVALIVAAGAAIPLPAATGATGGVADSALGKSEFKRRANAVCRTYTRKIRAIGVPTTRADVERWASLVKAQERQLAALTPPAAYATRYKMMLVAGRAIPPLLLAWDAAQRAGDVSRAHRLEGRARELADKRTRLADGMGLTACSAQ
jgi:hypothetical protein